MISTLSTTPTLAAGAALQRYRSIQICFGLIVPGYTVFSALAPARFCVSWGQSNKQNQGSDVIPLDDTKDGSEGREGSRRATQQRTAGGLINTEFVTDNRQYYYFAYQRYLHSMATR